MRKGGWAVGIRAQRYGTYKGHSFVHSLAVIKSDALYVHCVLKHILHGPSRPVHANNNNPTHIPIYGSSPIDPKQYVLDFPVDLFWCNSTSSDCKIISPYQLTPRFGLSELNISSNEMLSESI